MARVVIVDDSLVAREQLRRILTAAGHDVVGEAEDGLQAPQVVGRLKPDVVTLDMLMPGRDGLATLHHLRLRDPDLPVVVCSASATQRRVVDALRLGAKDFVAKPIDKGELLRAIDGALAPRCLAA
jgi:two-component system, chemotaxis family, chemotaxis protein CheY